MQLCHSLDKLPLNRLNNLCNRKILLLSIKLSRMFVVCRMAPVTSKGLCDVLRVSGAFLVITICCINQLYRLYCMKDSSSVQDMLCSYIVVR